MKYQKIDLNTTKEQLLQFFIKLNISEDIKMIEDLVDELFKLKLYGVFSKGSLYFEEGKDLIVDEKLIKFLKIKTGDQNLKFLSIETENILKSKCLSFDVNDDYEVSVKDNIDFKLKEDIDCLIIEMFPDYELFWSLYEKYFGKIDDINQNDEYFDKKWEIIESYLKYISHENINLNSYDYQYFGYQFFDIQGTYSNFIASYYGEYGDAGALFVSGCKDGNIYSTIDMH